MSGDEITTDLDDRSMAILRDYAAREKITVGYAASLLLTREINAIAANSLAPGRPSRGRIVEE